MHETNASEPVARNALDCADPGEPGSGAQRWRVRAGWRCCGCACVPTRAALRAAGFAPHARITRSGHRPGRTGRAAARAGPHQAV